MLDVRHEVSRTSCDVSRDFELAMPVFVREGMGVEAPLPTLAGIASRSIDMLPSYVQDLAQSSVRTVVLFAIPDKRDPAGSAALRSDSLVCRAIKAIKAERTALKVAADICFCQYTDHGQCRIVTEGHVDSERTLEGLAQQALHAAEAGVDIVMPSAMLEGSVRAIKARLMSDGHINVKIWSQGVKFASSFYGPFRKAAFASVDGIDKRSYQLDPCNARVAITRAIEEAEEGADLLVVKPALPYLDIVSKASRELQIPLGVFCTSSEYALFKARCGGDQSLEYMLAQEWVSAFKRAGANTLISYFAQYI